MTQAQQWSNKSLEDSTRYIDDFNLAIAKMKGLTYDFEYHIPPGFNQDGRMIIYNSQGYPIVISNFTKDSLHILVLVKTLFYDSTKNCFTEKIFDVITLTYKDEHIRFADTYCECNNKQDSTIIALVRDYEQEYIEGEDILRAWQINRESNLFKEISSIGIRCENMAYGD
jgi:hypothetical protein